MYNLPPGQYNATVVEFSTEYVTLIVHVLRGMDMLITLPRGAWHSDLPAVQFGTPKYRSIAEARLHGCSAWPQWGLRTLMWRAAWQRWKARCRKWPLWYKMYKNIDPKEYIAEMRKAFDELELQAPLGKPR